MGELAKIGIALKPATKGEASLTEMQVPHYITFSSRWVPPGTYLRMTVNGVLMMTDTPDERDDHSGFVYRANGRVLVAGLGLGLVLAELCQKPEVTHVTVVEKSQDVIDVVGPQYAALFGDKVSFVCADIFEWKPAKEDRWDYCWLDIWPTLNPDNLGEITTLKRRFARRVEQPVEAWVEDRLRRLKKKWDRELNQVRRYKAFR